MKKVTIPKVSKLSALKNKLMLRLNKKYTKR